MILYPNVYFFEFEGGWKFLEWTKVLEVKYIVQKYRITTTIFF